jgi:multidrug efflux pump subunit AcrA (membrane-fusion protein)
VEDASRYQLRATLPAGASSLIKKGSVARVQLDSMKDKSLQGKVTEIEAGADPNSHTLNARIDLPHGVEAESGLFGRAFFAYGDKQAVVVPLEVVVTRGQLRGIYAVDANGLVHWRVVTLGQPANGMVEVLSGVELGDSIVLNPGTQELDGKKMAHFTTGNEETHS